MVPVSNSSIRYIQCLAGESANGTMDPNRDRYILAFYHSCAVRRQAEAVESPYIPIEGLPPLRDRP